MFGLYSNIMMVLGLHVYMILVMVYTFTLSTFKMTVVMASSLNELAIYLASSPVCLSGFHYLSKFSVLTYLLEDTLLSV